MIPAFNRSILFAVLLFPFCSFAQDVVPHSFKSSIPSLQLLESGFPNVKHIDAKEYYKFEEVTQGSGHYKFTGIVITSKMMKKNLGITHDQYKPVTAHTDQTIKKVAVYCDSLVIDDSLWLPECDIELHCRVINMRKHSIKTSPIPWAKAVRLDAVSQNKDVNGQDGLDGGKVEIVCDKLIEPGKIVANGTDGEWTCIPKITIDWPQIPFHVEFYKNMGCNGPSSGYSKGVDVELQWGNMIAVVAKNSVDGCCPWSSTEYCTGYKTWDEGGIEFEGRKEDESYLTDKKEDTRINAARIKPGKGGNGGMISITYSTALPPNMDAYIHSEGGKNGRFKSRDDAAARVTYIADADGSCTGIGIDAKSFFAGKVSVDAAPIGIIWLTKYDWKSREIYVPSSSAKSKFINGLSLNSPNEAGKSCKHEFKSKEYTPHPEYFVMRTKYIREQYTIYHKKTATEQKALDEEINEIVKKLAQIIQAGQADISLKSGYLTAYNMALELSTYSQKNADDYNNPPGYRPMLSITNTLAYITKNLKTDLALYVLSDVMARGEQKLGEFKENLPGMIKNLYETNATLAGQLEEINRKYATLSTKASLCARKTDTIQTELKKLEEKLKEEAKKDQVKWELLKAGIKICGVAASVIPYGQPALGQIAGSTLDAFAANMEDDPANIATSVMEKIDMKGTMEMLAENKMQKLKPKEVQDDPADIEKMTVEEKKAHKRTADEAQYQKDITQYEKDLTEKKEQYAKAATGVRDALASFMKNSVKKDEIEKRLAVLRNENYQYKEIKGRLDTQLALKEEIFKEITELSQESFQLNTQIMENADNIAKLQKQYLGGLKYSKGLEDVLRDVRNASLSRLKWIEYQLVKVYEYTTLTPYTLKMPCNEVLGELYSRLANRVTPQNIDSIVNTLAVAYQGQQLHIGEAVLHNTSTGHKQDAGAHKGNYGRKIILTKSNNTGTYTDRFVDELNSEKHTTIIDLQKDLVDAVVKPDESEIRIIEISLDSIQFENEAILPFGLSADISFDVENGGVLRKGDHFYYFQADGRDEAIDKWKWTISNHNGKNTITNENEHSSQYTNLISFMTSQKEVNSHGKGRNIFTLPPAWSTCKVSMDFNGSDMVHIPRISKLIFSMRCDYVNVKSTQKVLDIKLQNAPEGLLYTTKINKDTMINYTNYYGMIKPNSEITVELKEPVMDPNSKEKTKFLRWNVTGAQVSNGNDLTNKKITVRSTNNTRIVAIYEPITN